MGRPIICELPGKMNWPLPLWPPPKPGNSPPITLLARSVTMGARENMANC